MEEAEMQQILSQAQIIRSNSASETIERRKIRRQLHALAEAQYSPAIDFFMSCLEDADSSWRLEAVRNLGFHYSFPSDSEITQKIRQLLLNDPDEDVRMASASILGIRSVWLDPVLMTALQSDPNEYVRYAAFDSFLTLAGVPYLVIRREMDKVEEGEIQPTFEEVKRIIAEVGIDIEALR